MKEYKIYALVDPLSREVRYVGVTTRTLSQRLSAHKHEVTGKRNVNTYKNNWFSKLLEANLIPFIILLEECSPDNWEDRERFWISIFDNGKLTNQREGGIGVVVDRKTTSIQRSANAKKIPIVQLAIDGSFIREWDSASDVQKEMNVFPERISKVCKHTTYTAGGFRWAFKTDYELGIIPPYKARYEVQIEKAVREVHLYDCHTGNYLESYESIIKLSKELNITASSAYRYKDKPFIFNEKYFISTSKYTNYIPLGFNKIQ